MFVPIYIYHIYVLTSGQLTERADEMIEIIYCILNVHDSHVSVIKMSVIK